MVCQLSLGTKRPEDSLHLHAPWRGFIFFFLCIFFIRLSQILPWQKVSSKNTVFVFAKFTKEPSKYSVESYPNLLIFQITTP